MIQKKIALLGVSGVGKTSLVRRFVQSMFDDKYLTTIGVKVDKKQVQVAGQDLMLMLWDVAGAETNFTLPSSYVKGSAGYLLVADGTRRATLSGAEEIVAQVNGDIGNIPFVLVLNKMDLESEWQINDADLAPFVARGCTILKSSAKTGVGVEEAFLKLAEVIAL